MEFKNKFTHRNSPTRQIVTHDEPQFICLPSGWGRLCTAISTYAERSLAINNQCAVCALMYHSALSPHLTSSARRDIAFTCSTPPKLQPYNAAFIAQYLKTMKLSIALTVSMAMGASAFAPSAPA